MINLYNCCCLKFMADKPDKYYDLAIVDPPYGTECDIYSGDNDKRHLNNRNGWNDKLWTNKNNEWNKMPDYEYFKELKRISKNQIIWGGNYFVNFLLPSAGWIFWDKGQRNFSCADGELAYTSFDKALRVFEFSRAKNNKTKRFHIAQKPIELYRWLLKNYAKEDDKIFDSHGGSGSILIACYDMGFDIDWCEIDKDYFEAVKKRYNTHVSQVRMF